MFPHVFAFPLAHSGDFGLQPQHWCYGQLLGEHAFLTVTWNNAITRISLTDKTMKMEEIYQNN